MVGTRAEKRAAADSSNPLQDAPRPKLCWTWTWFVPLNSKQLVERPVQQGCW
jgi:hypothetical protein